MKVNKLLFLAACFVGTVLNGQDTIYYKESDVVNSWDDVTRFKVIYRDELDSNKVNVKEYFKSGNIKSDLYYADYVMSKYDGNQKVWSENGQLLSEIDYAQGKIHGTLRTYWEDGKSRRIDFYEDGNFIKGQCFDADGNEIPHFDYVVNAEFPGGLDKLMDYLKTEVQYSRKCKRRGIQGTVILEFVITDEGKVTNVKVIQSVHDDLDEESMRAVRNMPLWTPAIIDGETSSIRYILPIKFTLR